LTSQHVERLSAEAPRADDDHFLDDAGS
jgi:hypothetical protein